MREEQSVLFEFGLFFGSVEDVQVPTSHLTITSVDVYLTFEFHFPWAIIVAFEGECVWLPHFRKLARVLFHITIIRLGFI